MADQTVEPSDLAEIVVDSVRVPSWRFNINDIKRLNFLKACRFGFFMPSVPRCFSVNDIELSPKTVQNMRFLCDSVEFPGKSLETVEYKIAGKNRAKIPYLRRYNEISLSFYHETEFPMYDFFSDWLDLASPRDTLNSYYDDIVVPNLILIQFDAVAENRIAIRKGMKKYFTVRCKNAFPTNVASMQGNWADEGYHKLNVTFTIEEFEVVAEDPRSKIGNFALEADSEQTAPTKE